MDELDFEDEAHEVIDTGTLDGYVLSKYHKAERAKYTDEVRMVDAFKNFRGIYESFTEREKSKVFIKVTKSKVMAAYGQVIEVLLGGNKFPLTIEPTILPDGVEEAVHIDTDAQVSQAMGRAPEPKDMSLRPGETYQSYLDRLGPLDNDLAPVKDSVKKGEGQTPTQVTFHPAAVAAKKMEKKIHDQLEESQAHKALRSTAFEMVLFGTGVMQGPFSMTKEYPRWNDEGEYEPLRKVIPKVAHVSVWDFYPDPDGNTMEETQYVVRRHKMSRSDLRNLKSRPYFDKERIEVAIDFGENYIKKWWEQIMDGDDSDPSSERYEVLEFWGNVDVSVLEEHGVELDSDFSDLDEVSANVWIVNGQVIRAIVNPFVPTIVPFYVCPYELNPYSMFGIGVAENMEDTQILMNGFMRMAVDNAALSGNLVFEIDENMLTPGQDLEIFPGKVFVRQEGAPGQGLFSHQFQNVSAQNMQMFEMARRLADESTGIPSFSHGQTGVQGVGRTASGISMLMGAANGSIRTVVKNVDDYLLSPMGKAMFSFNMQFDFDPEIKGDLEVRARGTESLMANEVRSQRLMQFLGVVQNPALAPFAKMDYIIREIAKSLDLDADKVANSTQQAAIQAMIMKEFQQPLPEGQQQLPPGADASVPTAGGGGAIGSGSAPVPGEQGFSGNTGEVNEQLPS